MWWRAWRAGLLLVLAAALSGCGTRGSAAKESGEEAKKEGDEAHVEVKVVPARLGPERTTVESLGRCEALPDHLATLTPAIEGHVHALLVQEGDAVRKGQPIVELDKTVAQADLDEKTAARDGLKASLALLQSVPRTEERRANELAVEHAQRAVEQAQANVNRLQPLRERREISEQQMHDAMIALEQAKIQQRTAEATLHAMLIGPRPEAVAEAKGKIKTADALVSLAQAHLDYTTIRAPIDGVLDSLTCHPGQTIAIGAAIGEVVDTRQVFAAVWLPPRSARNVRIGQAVEIAARNLMASPAAEEPKEEADMKEEPDKPEAGQEDEPDKNVEVERQEDAEMTQSLTGRIAFIGRIADPQTGNLPVHVLVDNPHGLLAIGQTVRVSILLAERENVLQVPAAAVNDLGEGPVVSVVRDGKAVVLHPQVGTAHGGWVAVTGTDLKPGEPVVVAGGYNLPDGTGVKIAGESEDEEHEAEPGAADADAKKAEAAK